MADKTLIAKEFVLALVEKGWIRPTDNSSNKARNESIAKEISNAFNIIIENMKFDDSNK